MTTEEFIIALFGLIDDPMKDVPKIHKPSCGRAR